MDAIENIRSRRSIRSYKPDPVPRDVLEEVIDASQWAASPGNMQPWEFAVLGGDVLEEYKRRLGEKFKVDAPSELEFLPPLDVPEIYDKRRSAWREMFNGYLNPPDTENLEEKKLAYYLKMGRLFDAPCAIIIYTDKRFLNLPWGIMSIGIIAQNICLGALAHGLGTCIMGKTVDWPNIVRDLLEIPHSKAIMCAIPIGYPDQEDRANNGPRSRTPLEEWVHWYGF